MSIGHKDPALVTAQEDIARICECGEFHEEHTPEGYCGATGCTCEKFKQAALIVSRPTRKRLPDAR